MRKIRKSTAPTIEDVARQAGVSISTVSNVLNDRSSRMRPETLSRVQSVITGLGYRPNQAARRLKTGHMKTLGLLVPSIGNPFYAGMVRWIEEAALRHGYGLLLCNTQRSAEREQEYAQALMAQGTQGVIVGTALEEVEHLAPLMERGLAVVSLDRTAQQIDAPIDYVTMDNQHAGQIAAEHLLALGHQHIGYVTTPLRPVNQLRLDGVHQSCKAANIDLDIQIVDTKDAQPDAALADLGWQAAGKLLAKKCKATGFVVMNDMMAIGLMAGLRDANIRVPEEVSIIGIDDIFLDRFVTPSLSTVRQPIREIATAAVDRVMDRMRHADELPHELVFTPELVARKSTGPVANTSR